MKYLFDVNAVIAGVYVDHEHHGRMRTWMKEHQDEGFGVPPIAMTGCLRVLMTISGERKPSRIVSAIMEFKDFYGLTTIADQTEISDLGKWISGPKQVRDAHFLTIAKHHGIKLVTFDRNISGRDVLCLN